MKRRGRWTWEKVDPARLLPWRQAKGLSRREVAVMLGVGESSVFLWEQGGHAPRSEVQARVERLLDDRRVVLPRSAPPLSGEAIRAFRTRHRWSRARLAKALGVSEATVHGWESGNTRPSALLASRLRTLVDEAGDGPEAPSGAGVEHASLEPPTKVTKKRTKARKMTANRRAMAAAGAADKRTGGRRGGRKPGTWKLVTPMQILAYRKEHRVSRARMAQALGVSSTSVQNWESGTVATLQAQQRIATLIAASPAAPPAPHRVRHSPDAPSGDEGALLATGTIVVAYAANRKDLAPDQLVGLIQTVRGALR